MAITKETSVLEKLIGAVIREEQAVIDGEKIDFRGLVVAYTDPNGEIQEIKFVPHKSEGKSAYAVLQYAQLATKSK